MRTDRHTDRRVEGETDTTKLIVIFHNFANAPEDRKHMVSRHIRRYRNLPLSSKLYQYCSAGFERPKNMAKKILCHARLS